MFLFFFFHLHFFFKNLQTQSSRSADGRRDWYNLSGRQVALISQIFIALLPSDLAIVLLGTYPKEIIRGKQRLRHKHIPWLFITKETENNTAVQQF